MPNHKVTLLLCALVLTPMLQGCAAVVAGSAAATTGVMVAQDRRTTGTVIDDQAIEFKANRKLNTILAEEPGSRVSIVSYNNNVLLLGQTPSEDARQRVEKAIRDVANINSLHNQIQVSDPLSITARSKDSWITTKIKSEMLLEKDFNPTRVKVITEGATVYLLGIVNPREEEIAVDIARHTKGVKRVVKMFEYMPS